MTKPFFVEELAVMREDVTPYHCTPRALTSSVLCSPSADEWLRTCHVMLDHCACIDSPQALNYALLGIHDTLAKYKAAKLAELQ